MQTDTKDFFFVLCISYVTDYYAVVAIQEKRSHSGLRRRQEDVEEDNEPVTGESASTHDAKAARATWRKYILQYYAKK